MIKLTLLASLLASFTIAFGSARAGAQPLDPNQAQASPTPAAPPMLAADAGSPLQTAPPTEVADVEALPAAAPVGPGAERAVVTAPAPAGSEVEAKAAAEMAALQSDLASGGAANGNEQSRLNLYGFADFTYSRNQNPLAGAAASTFSVGNLNLYMASELGDEWRSLIEVRFMYLPNGGQSGATPFDPRIDTTFYDSTDWNRPLQWGGIHIERAWLERTFHKLLTVRVGNWLTPYGIWNVDHGSPVVIGVQRPFIVGESLLPESQTGIEIYGTADIANVQLGYHLTLSNGRGPASAITDLDNNKAVGGRLFVRKESAFGTVNLGGAFYRGRYTNSHTAIGVDANGVSTTTAVMDSQYDELSLSADLKWQWGGLLVQGEAIENQVAFVKGGRTVSTAVGPSSFDSDSRRWGTYGLAGYRFAFLGTMPYGGAGYYKEGSSGWIPKIVDFWLGLNLRPTPRVVLKLQYTQAHFYPGYPGPDVKLIAVQTAWSF
jgi:hypothetical protein